ncbi:adenosylcobalamin-dependent ribonucleoside-diphosphate reductase [Limnohabitans sp.]|jgi:ribonucleoside-diphosphate reductase alpha chain|uniref:adenosylcobalamin-dependent ribonucleoside-diphosphate reductase n=1 Tax=Limnohabitans sp. TaxID=1907725 RepID=UPI0037C18C3C
MTPSSFISEQALAAFAAAPCAPSPASFLAPQALSQAVLQSKYLQPGELTAGDVFDRVAKAIASVEAPDQRVHFEAVFRQQLAAGAIGAGRIMAGAGAETPVTLANCFVQPVGDCLGGCDEAGYPSIHDALAQAAETLRRGGGVGYDFSRIRPQGARVNGTGLSASGPCRFIDAFDKSCAALQTTGARRGAQMAVLRCDHPDILAFVSAKQTPGRWACFNVSVGITDAFLQAVEHDQGWELVHRISPRELRQPAGSAASLVSGPYVRGDGQWVYQSLPARTLWSAITRAAHHSAEPGVLFLDTIDRDNNLRTIETIEATNPCGEQPLPSYGGCVLGPLILPRFVRHAFGVGGPAAFDISALAHAVRWQVRALDNLLDIAAWPLPQQASEARAKRRIGIGFTGLGDALVMLGLRYDMPQGRKMARRIAQAMRDNAYTASVALAKERGTYPLFDANVCLAPGTFASRLSPALRASIRKHGLRNSHLLSIAPTGSVSLAFADHCSTGIEPVFDWSYTRRFHASDGHRHSFEAQNHAWRLYQSLGRSALRLPSAFVTALQIRPEHHIAMVAAVQPFVDGAISKTVNLPAQTSVDEIAALFMQAWREGLKGLTIFRPNPVRRGVLQPNSPPAKFFGS